MGEMVKPVKYKNVILYNQDQFKKKLTLEIFIWDNDDGIYIKTGLKMVQNISMN